MYSKPRWPSLREQLDSGQIRRGSALERLIRANQDVALLDPREANDDADIPPWLRVFWRKNHPDVEHSTVNPGGGYPDILYTIHSWMLANPDLPWGSPSAPQDSQSPPPQSGEPSRDLPQRSQSDLEGSQPSPPRSDEQGRRPSSRQRDA